MAFVYGLQTLELKYLSKIYQLKCLKPKNKGHANFYECSDLTEKVYLESLLLDQRLKINNYWQKWSCSSIKKSFKHVDIFSLSFRRKKMQVLKNFFNSLCLFSLIWFYAAFWNAWSCLVSFLGSILRRERSRGIDLLSIRVDRILESR